MAQNPRLPDVLVRIDCPHCQGEITVAWAALPEEAVACEGCGRALDLADCEVRVAVETKAA